MSDIRFDHQEYIHLLWLVLLLACVFMYGFWRKRRGLRAFATANLHEALVPRVIPDVFVEPAEGGRYQVRLEDARIPSLFISSYYRKLISSGKANEETREYI